MEFMYKWYKTKIKCPKFEWKLKYIHLVKDILFHLTRLPARKMEQSHLSPREYISTFTLINIKYLYNVIRACTSSIIPLAGAVFFLII